MTAACLLVFVAFSIGAWVSTCWSIDSYGDGVCDWPTYFIGGATAAMVLAIIGLLFS